MNVFDKDNSEYREAINILLECTRMAGTSGARASALVLLAAYNAAAWPLDISELRILDLKHKTAAMKVIRFQAENSVEPHTLIKDGDSIFRALWDQFEEFRASSKTD